MGPVQLKRQHILGLVNIMRLLTPAQALSMQVWLAYSAVTGYLLYLCSAKRRMAPTTPKRVSSCFFESQSLHPHEHVACPP